MMNEFCPKIISANENIYAIYESNFTIYHTMLQVKTQNVMICSQIQHTKECQFEHMKNEKPIWLNLIRWSNE